MTVTYAEAIGRRFASAALYVSAAPVASGAELSVGAVLSESECIIIFFLVGREGVPCVRGTWLRCDEQQRCLF